MRDMRAALTLKYDNFWKEVGRRSDSKRVEGWSWRSRGNCGFWKGLRVVGEGGLGDNVVVKMDEAMGL